jgi:hypothetical protein
VVVSSVDVAPEDGEEVLDPAAVVEAMADLFVCTVVSGAVRGKLTPNGGIHADEEQPRQSGAFACATALALDHNLVDA